MRHWFGIHNPSQSITTQRIDFESKVLQANCEIVNFIEHSKMPECDVLRIKFFRTLTRDTANLGSYEVGCSPRVPRASPFCAHWLVPWLSSLLLPPKHRCLPAPHSRGSHVSQLYFNLSLVMFSILGLFCILSVSINTSSSLKRISRINKQEDFVQRETILLKVTPCRSQI